MSNQLAFKFNSAQETTSPLGAEPQTAQTLMTWREILKDETESTYFKDLQASIKSERAAGKIIYPPHKDVFNALKFTEFHQVKVVIIGQDPYHGPGQAHGLCFSVQVGVPAPPSLVNIFKELKSDLGCEIPNHGYLESWARQGVLLLNTVLTVEQNKPASHKGRGWEKFTDKIIQTLSQNKSGLVFLLWGAHAQCKRELIDAAKHTVLMCPHPSPFSADKGFFGCKHFSRANAALKAQGLTTIDWQLANIANQN